MFFLSILGQGYVASRGGSAWLCGNNQRIGRRCVIAWVGNVHPTGLLFLSSDRFVNVVPGWIPLGKDEERSVLRTRGSPDANTDITER